MRAPTGNFLNFRLDKATYEAFREAAGPTAKIFGYYRLPTFGKEADYGRFGIESSEGLENFRRFVKGGREFAGFYADELV